MLICMDSFRKPLRAVEIQLSEYHRLKQQRQLQRRAVIIASLVAFGVFATGMTVTNFAKISSLLTMSLSFPTAANQRSYSYFRSCAAARAAGQAPIRSGSPGYRIVLDADGDGIACEPYMNR